MPVPASTTSGEAVSYLSSAVPASLVPSGTWWGGGGGKDWRRVDWLAACQWSSRLLRLGGLLGVSHGLDHAAVATRRQHDSRTFWPKSSNQVRGTYLQWPRVFSDVPVRGAKEPAGSIILSTVWRANCKICGCLCDGIPELELLCH